MEKNRAGVGYEVFIFHTGDVGRCPPDIRHKSCCKNLRQFQLVTLAIIYPPDAKIRYKELQIERVESK